MSSSTATPVRTPVARRRMPRVIQDRERQSVLQIKDRVWRAKIRKVERIEEEEDYMWGLIAARVRNDPNDESVPWEVARRELGLDRDE